MLCSDRPSAFSKIPMRGRTRLITKDQNSAAFARRPLVRYMLPLNKKWQLNFGLEKSSSEVDTSIDPDAQQVNHAADGGLASSVGMTSTATFEEYFPVQLDHMGANFEFLQVADASEHFTGINDVPTIVTAQRHNHP